MPAIKILHNAFFPQLCGLGEIGIFRFEGVFQRKTGITEGAY